MSGREYGVFADPKPVDTEDRPDKHWRPADHAPQLELSTVINHINIDAPIIRTHKDTHKPAGVRLAKMLSMYDDSPSSQLWSDIQQLAREILK